MFDAALGEAGIERELTARLLALVPAEAGHKAVLTRTALPPGPDAAKAILALAEQEGVDAIVLSTHGQTGLLSRVRGSVADAVLQGSTRPVLVVKPE